MESSLCDSLQVEGQTDEELAFLLGHDSDPFCRWEAGQTLLRALLTKLYNAAKQQKVRIPASLCMPEHAALHAVPSIHFGLHMRLHSFCCKVARQPDLWITNRDLASQAWFLH